MRSFLNCLNWTSWFTEEPNRFAHVDCTTLCTCCSAQVFSNASKNGETYKKKIKNSFRIFYLNEAEACTQAHEHPVTCLMDTFLLVWAKRISIEGSVCVYTDRRLKSLAPSSYTRTYKLKVLLYADANEETCKYAMRIRRCHDWILRKYTILLIWSTKIM